MIICVDAGNTNITYGIYKNDELYCTFRSETKEITSRQKMLDDFLGGLNQYMLDPKDIEYAIISSVVPSIDATFEYVFSKLEIFYKFIDYNSNIGVDIKIDDPSELGSDLLVAAYQVINKYPLPSIIIDMGTATTIFAIDEKSALIGGMIYPGLISSYNNLVKDTSKLVKTNLSIPENVISKSTVSCMQSGMFYGTSSMINEVVRLMKDELNTQDVTVVITGGVASFMHPYINDSIYDENLILDGLKSIYMKYIKKEFFF